MFCGILRIAFLSSYFLWSAFARNTHDGTNDTRDPICNAKVFSDVALPGIRVLEVQANDVRNFNISTFQNGDIPSAEYVDLEFCNVTVIYVRGSQHSPVRVTVWLPKRSRWNGRFQGTGGGGYMAGFGPLALAPAVARGYAASSTDGGNDDRDPSEWALNEDGNVNLDLLEDFAHLSLNDLARIGKAVIWKYFNRHPVYSYWSGCSTGGRQGMMLAQRYPDAFDGILALAPAINWPSFQVAAYWPQQVMNQLNYYPAPCELEYITNSAITACDGMDGLADGVLSSPNRCDFDATTLIGQLNGCSGGQTQVTSQAAQIAMAAWSGPTSTGGHRLWPGLNRDAALAGLPGLTTAETNCSSGTSQCEGVPFSVAEKWIRLFVEKDTDFDIKGMSQADYELSFEKSLSQYDDIIGTSSPELSAFRNSGGKILSWHGLADQLIPPNGTAGYYDRVFRQDRKVHDFYRLFFAPGTRHCQAGAGPYPYDSLDALVDWVEHGKAPDVLVATKRPGDDAVTRLLYPYLLK